MEPDAAVPAFSMPPIPTRSGPLGGWFRNAMQTMNQNASKYNKDKGKSRRENSRTLAGILNAPPPGAYGGPYATTWPQLPIGAGTGVLDNLGGGRTRRASKEADRVASGFLNDVVPGVSSAIASAANNAVDYGASAIGGMRGAAQAAIDTPGMIPDGSLYTGEELRRQLEATSGSIIPPGLRPIPQQQVEANARQARVDAFNREASRDQAYRDALNTRFQGQNMDGTTFDRLPTDSEAQALAASSFRNSGRQVMPRITTNSTFPGQVNPNVGRATVVDPYGGPNQYAWQGRDASYGNRTYRSVTTDPRTGQTYITNFSTPRSGSGGGNANLSSALQQPPTLSPRIDPVTGGTIEAPQVAEAQRMEMDRIRAGQPSTRKRQDWENLANTMGIPKTASDAMGRKIPLKPEERRALMRQQIRAENADRYASNEAAWGNIRANRQAQNAGFANALQMQLFRDIAMAQAGRGAQPLINVQQGGLGGVQNAAPQANRGQQQLPSMNGPGSRPVVDRRVNPTVDGSPRLAGGMTDTQLSELRTMRDNGASGAEIKMHLRDKFGIANETMQNQIFHHLYPDGSRSARYPDGTPIGIMNNPNGILTPSNNPLGVMWRQGYDFAAPWFLGGDRQPLLPGAPTLPQNAAPPAPTGR